MWFSSDRNKRRVPCGSSTRVCISACARRWAQVCSRLIERGGEWRRGEGGKCFGNFYARVSSFISAAPTIEKLAVVAAVWKPWTRLEWILRLRPLRLSPPICQTDLPVISDALNHTLVGRFWRSVERCPFLSFNVIFHLYVEDKREF